ncbi:putative cytochrome P450 E-class, group I [Rhypophila sp. PSN 637]
MFSDALLGHLPFLVSALILFWVLSTIIYRRYFHPLSKVPGLREGQLMHVLPGLHAKYGPVVRISPNEVHLSGPEAYDKIHNVGTKFYKDPSFYSPLDGVLRTPIILTIISNDQHRVQRGAITPFFSRRSVLELEGMVLDKLRKLKKEAGVFDMHHAIRAFSVDVITEYGYARCWNQMDAEDYGKDYQDAIRSIQGFMPYLLSFPAIVLPIFGLLPDGLLKAASPPFRRWIESVEVVNAGVIEVRNQIAQGIKPARRTIFHDLMEPPVSIEDKKVMPEGMKHRQSLSDETVLGDAVNVTGAGAETTGSTTARAIIEVLSNPVIYQRLTKDLRDEFPDGIDSMTLPAPEKLPLLTGVIKEALRLNPGLPGHLPRVVPPSGATFNGYTLPGGTSVSMSAWVQHHNPEAFPNPTVFDPYRWIDNDVDKICAQERCMIHFGRGTRNCVGQNLAMCELYVCLAAIFHRFGYDAAPGEGRLEAEPGFVREDLRILELILGYHPVNARKFGIVMRR